MERDALHLIVPCNEPRPFSMNENRHWSRSCRNVRHGSSNRYTTSGNGAEPLNPLCHAAEREEMRTRDREVGCMASGPKRYRVGYRAANGSWIVGAPQDETAVVGYLDPATDTWYEGVADIQSGQWLPEDSVLGTGTRDCPAGYPVKGNLPSRIFHVPGQPTYGRTNPEVCFATEAAAASAGFRRAAGGAAAAAAAATGAAAAAAPAAAAASSQRVNAPSTPTPPPPPRPTAPPPAPEPKRNWLWWLLGALVILALIWWFTQRQNQAPPPVTPEATVSAPAAGTTEAEETEGPEAATPDDAMGIVASPAAASPVAAAATPMSAAADMATPMAAAATPLAAAGEATPVAAEASPALATAVAEAVETAEAEIEATP